jgi:hypothetical protein
MTTNPQEPPSRRPSVTISRLIAAAWRSTPPVLRRFAIRTWFIAAIAAAAAIVADCLGVWGNLRFTANLLSEAIGAAIAAPVAFVVVSQLAAYQSAEATRPRYEATIRAARAELLAAVQGLRKQILMAEQTVTEALNEFIEATKPNDDNVLADPDRATAAASAVRSHLHPSELAMTERGVAQVRQRARFLQDMMMLEGGTYDFRAVPVHDLAQASGDLRLALRRHGRNVNNGYALFGRQGWLPAKNRARIIELRRTAVDCLGGLDEMLAHCAQLERLSADTD